MAALLGLAAAVGSAVVWKATSPKATAEPEPALREATVLEAPSAPLARVPGGTAPSAGWPTLVLLHGRGSSPDSMLEMAEVARDVGLAAVVPTGPLRMADARHEWSMDLDAMHRYLDRAVLDASQLGAWKADRTRCYLGGFSQGASVALALAARDPDSYLGVLAISPVSPARPNARTSAPASVTAWILVGADDAVAYRAANDTAESWREAGWPIVLETHPGGHQPPEDWAERVRGAALRQLRGPSLH